MTLTEDIIAQVGYLVISLNMTTVGTRYKSALTGQFTVIVKMNYFIQNQQ